MEIEPESIVAEDSIFKRPCRYTLIAFSKIEAVKVSVEDFNKHFGKVIS